MAIEQKIYEIIIRYFDGTLNEKEEKELILWLELSPENQKTFVWIKDIWETSRLNKTELAATENEWIRLREKILSRSRNAARTKLIRLRTWQGAAAILILALIVSLFISSPFTGRKQYYYAFAPKGSISQVMFPDGTNIFINAGSKLKYKPDDGRSKREVYLDGEAYFEVAKDKRRPFVVHTPCYDVNVTGTKFNVKAYQQDDKVMTTLEEGSVRITSAGSVHLPKEYLLSPGEQITFTKSENTVVKLKVNPVYFVSWKDNKLIFLNMDFRELLVLMERKYGVNIKVEEKDILDYHYTGTIRNESVLEMLDIIKYTLPLDYRIEGQEIIIFKSK